MAEHGKRILHVSGDPNPQKPSPHNDNRPPATGALLMDDLVMGVRFFSRLPSGDRPHQIPSLSRIAQALPFASLIIGLIPVLILSGATGLGLPGIFSGAMAVGAAVIITGAMAEDGLADAADGLFGGNNVARRLEIMKDSSHGTYGVAALCLLLLLRVAALAQLAAIHPLIGAALWLAAMLLARSGALWLSVALPPARPDGVSAAAGRVSRRAFCTGGVFALMLGFVLAAPFTGIVGLVAALLLIGALIFGWTWLCRRLVGGQTGDLIGALQAMIEIAALTAFMIFA